MIEVYEGGILVTHQGIQAESLVIDTRRGKILPPKLANLAKKRHDASHLVFYPALINAHDHLDFNHYPRTRWRDQYENASQWASDMQHRLDLGLYADLRALPLELRYQIGAVKNLLSGVGTVAHHNADNAILRRRDFPIRVLHPYRWAHSLYLSSDLEIRRAHWRTWHGGKFFIHLAEGTDQAANHELLTLDHLGCLTEKTILIHGVGLRNENLNLAIQKSGGLVWCPSSNAFLLGQTANIHPWLKAEKLMLGSDSKLTADGDLWDEMRVAAGFIPAETIFQLVTYLPARRLGLRKLGDLEAGYHADIIALSRPSHTDYYQALLEAERPQWMMRNGHLVWMQTDHQPNYQWREQNYWISPQLSAEALSMVGLERLEK